MSKIEDFGFVYIWKDKKRNRFYIGSHWGTEDDGYICSSKWMRDCFNRRPHDFKRRILSRIYTDRKDTYEKEQQWLNLIQEHELGNNYYNRTKTLLVGMGDAWNKGKTNCYSPETLEKMKLAKLGKPNNSETKFKPDMTPWNKDTVGLTTAWNKGLDKEFQPHYNKSRSDETKLKISEAQKGKSRPAGSGMSGKNHSDETKLKISLSKQNCSDETRRKISESKTGIASAFKGKSHSVEANEKNRLAHLGRKHSEETRMKMRLAQQRRNELKKINSLSN